MELGNEIIDKKISVTKRKGYVQIFADEETCKIIQEFNKDSIFLFLDYLKKIKKIKFKKRETEEIYRHFINR